MARIEKTVFISYRRKDISWALAVYQYLTSHKYDVFFDYTSLSGGDFEQVIVSNIKARAHFILILTPTALERCSQSGDWLRREMETAIDEKRNIIPLFFDGFNFSAPSVVEKLTGKLASVNRYNGLDVPAGYFMEAMERLRGKYLNVPLDAVIHPVSTEVRKVVKEEQVAANEALLQKREDLKELVKPAEEKPVRPMLSYEKKATVFPPPLEKRGKGKILNLRFYGLVTAILLIVALGILGIKSAFQNTVRKAPSHPSIGSTWIQAADNMVMVYVPAGEFIMGSDTGKGDEKPAHTVYVNAFWIDQTEVTNSMYAKCVDDGSCAKPSDQTYFEDSKYTSHPVVYVTWKNAKDYCSWAGRRLLTEAEWEKAARGIDGRKYPWGTGIDCIKSNYDASCVGNSQPVGSYESGKSPYFAYDMAGNVWEWVSSIYLPYPYIASDGRENLLVNGKRVSRGGGWRYGAIDALSYNRNWDFPASSYNLIGFRCAMSASE